MPLQASIQKTERGPLLNVLNDQSGQRAGVFVPTFPEGSPLAKAAATLTVGLENYAGNIRTAVAQYLPNVVGQHLQAAAKNVLAGPTVAFQSVAIGEQQAITKANALAMSVVPATVATAPIRARAVKQFDEAADIAAKAAMLQNFTLEQMSGLVEVGALDQVPDDLAQVARDRFVPMAHVARTGLTANFQLQPTASEPLASGPDTAAAMAAAQTSFDALKARSATVADAAQVLRNVTLVVALACDLTPDDAFALLTN